jgi:2-polyprenyl-3-methyl-5-hydroxy-6-metoxy-1,4-benzoquinol methylase
LPITLPRVVLYEFSQSEIGISPIDMDKRCLVCHCVSHKLHKNSKYYSCLSCGTFYVAKNKERKKIIRDLNIWAKEIIDTSKNTPSPSKTLYERVNILLQADLSGKKLLDVGCGIPDFLRAAKESGFRVSGMDVAEPIRKQLIKNKITAYTSFKGIQKSTFDVVTNFDVIEHTTNPVSFIREINKVTRKGGTLLLSTPNAASLSAKVLGESWWVFGPEGHYVLFTPKSIRILLEKNGYSIVDLKTNTLTQWIHTRFQFLNRIGNKIIYCMLFPFFPFLFFSELGDNIGVFAKKIR